MKIPQNDVRMVYAFDVDRTLAEPNGSRDLSSYTPIFPIVNLAQSFQKFPGAAVVVTTARPESTREVTEEWLRDNGISPVKLLMRAEGDEREDKQVRVDQISMVKEIFGCEVVLYDDKTSNCQAVEFETRVPCVRFHAYGDQ